MPAIETRAALLARALLLSAALCACSDDLKGDGEPAPKAVAPPITPLPYGVTLDQRSFVDIPASGGDIRLTIGDVTGGQVTCGLTELDGTEILPRASTKPGEARAFRLRGADLVLQLGSIQNKLIGMDSATFSICAASPAASTSTEVDQIEALLQAIAGLEGAVFLRNGGEYTAQEAADHLRAKWSSQKAKIDTAAQFIDRLASKSSLSGRDYRIRFADGREVTARAFLEERLAELARVHPANILR